MKDAPPINFSIIIPIYNAENYLQNCLESLVIQNHQDMEILVINDGSTDGSLAIAEVYAIRYSNIKILSQFNQGVSTARNTGIELARGKYLLFLDADDKFEVNLFQNLRATLQSQSFDMISFGYIRQGGDTKSNRVYQFKKFNQSVFSGVIFTQLFLRKKINQHICSLAVKRQLLVSHNITFNKNIKLGEDIAFQIKVMSVAKSIKYLAEKYFVYHYNPNSQTNKRYGTSHLSCIDNYADVREFFQRNKLEKLILDLNFFYQYMFFYELQFFVVANRNILERYLRADGILKASIINRFNKANIILFLLKNLYKLDKNIIINFFLRKNKQGT